MKLLLSILLLTFILSAHGSELAHSSAAGSSEAKEKEEDWLLVLAPAQSSAVSGPAPKKQYFEGIPLELYGKYKRLQELSRHQVTCSETISWRGKRRTYTVADGDRLLANFDYRGLECNFNFKLADKPLDSSRPAPSFAVGFMKHMNSNSPNHGIGMSTTNTKQLVSEYQQFCHPAPDISMVFIETEKIRQKVQHLLHSGLNRAHAQKKDSQYWFVFEDEDTLEKAYNAGYETMNLAHAVVFNYGSSGDAKFMLIAHQLLLKAQKEGSFEYVAHKEGEVPQKIARVNILDITPASVAYWLE